MEHRERRGAGCRQRLLINVTVIVDLTSVRQNSGPAWLLGMFPGRSTAVFKIWLAELEADWKNRMEVVHIGWFTDFKIATATELPEAVEVLDPFHVVKLGSDAMEKTRQRVRREQRGRRDLKDDPLYTARLTLSVGMGLATDEQKTRLEDLFKIPEHGPIQLFWSVFQRIVDAYRPWKPEAGQWALSWLIDEIGVKVTVGLPELKRLGTTLKWRKADAPAYFDHVGSFSNHTAVLNGRFEQLRGVAMGVRNLVHYFAQSLLETGGFRPAVHAWLRRVSLVPTVWAPVF